jgi:hypothetical protein
VEEFEREVERHLTGRETGPGYGLIDVPTKPYMDRCCGETDGAVNSVDRCGISRFIIFGRAVCTATILKRT